MGNPKRVAATYSSAAAFVDAEAQLFLLEPRLPLVTELWPGSRSLLMHHAKECG